MAIIGLIILGPIFLGVLLGPIIAVVRYNNKDLYMYVALKEESSKLKISSLLDWSSIFGTFIFLLVSGCGFINYVFHSYSSFVMPLGVVYGFIIAYLSLKGIDHLDQEMKEKIQQDIDQEIETIKKKTQDMTYDEKMDLLKECYKEKCKYPMIANDFPYKNYGEMKHYKMLDAVINELRNLKDTGKFG